MKGVRELRRCVRELGMKGLRVLRWLWNLPKPEIEKIYGFLKNQAFEYDENNEWHRSNVWDCFQFIDRQVKTWRDQSGELLK